MGLTLTEIELGIALPVACDDCGHLVLRADLPWNPNSQTEYFMLRPDVWKLVTGDPHDSRGVLCVRCTEQALGRELCAADFAVDDDADADIALRMLGRPTQILAKRRATDNEEDS